MKRKIGLKGATLIDGNGGRPIENSLILIEGDLITYAGMNRELEGNDWELFSLEGMTLLPGLIECHVHLGGALGINPIDWVLEDDREQAIRSVKQARDLLEHGFTTARDISKNGLQLKKSINCGETSGPRLLACGPGLSRRGGHGDCPELPLDLVQKSHPWAVIADGEEEVRKAVRDLLKQGSDCIKVWATGGGLWERERETDQHYTQRELNVMVEEANYYGMEVCAHCESLAGTKAALKAGIKSVEHGEELDEECLALMKENKVAMVPTLSVFFEWFENHEPAYRPILEELPGNTLAEKEIYRIIKNVQNAKKAGIHIAVGADSFSSTLTPYGAYSLREIHALVRAGFSEMEAIVAATKSGAELLGFQDMVGTIEKGKYADLLVMKKNPLQDIQNFHKDNLVLVMKGGVVEAQSS